MAKRTEGWIRKEDLRMRWLCLSGGREERENGEDKVGLGV
jgi:hypothetical protein